MTYNKAMKHIQFARAFLMWLAVAIAIFWLPGCGRNSQRTSNPPTNSNSAVPTGSPDHVWQSFRFGESVSPSLITFIQNMKDKCALASPPPQQRQAIERQLLERIKYNPAKADEYAGGPVSISVYFHIITNAGGTKGNVSDAVVQSQIDVLNANFASTPFRFTLAGTDRTANDTWFNMVPGEVPTAEEQAAKAALNKGDESALNIYTVKLADRPFGWARWPWNIADGADGVVVSYSTLPGGDAYFYNQGDTATHEVGHWFGLFHTFENGCEAPGDSVDDTPAEMGGSLGCPSVRDTCPEDLGEDSVDNFMNFTYDGCMVQFTPGQSNRMVAMYEEHRTP